MIPMEIYRCDEDGEYTVTFSEQEIDKIHSKFMKNYTSTEVFNLEHDAEQMVPAYILETWIVDKPLEDKAYTTFGIEVPKGTLMMTTQITDNEYYNELVKNGQTGYSIEGFLGMKLSEIINKNNTNKKEEKMNEQTLLPAGEYTDKDGNVFVVAEDGTVTTKTEMGLEVAPEAEAQPEVTGTTETKLEQELSEDVVEEVSVEEEMAEETPADAAVDTAEEVVDTELPIDSYSKEEVDAKFEELYKLIAKMQAEDDSEDTTENEVVEPTEMSVQDRFSAFVAFSKKSL